MGIYRELCKQIYKTYHKNSLLRSYFTGFVRINSTSMNNISE